MANTEIQHDERLLKQLFTPSYLSTSISVLLTAVVMGAAAFSKLNSSQGRLAEALKTVSESDHHLLQLHLGDGSSRLSQLLLFVFWACIGLVVYYFVIGLARGIAEIGEVGRELGYVNTSRRSLALGVAARLGVRLLAVVGLFVALSLLLKFAIPFAVSAVEASSRQTSSIMAIVVGALFVLLTSHLVVVMARLVVLRPRLFSTTI